MIEGAKTTGAVILVWAGIFILPTLFVLFLLWGTSHVPILNQLVHNVTDQ